MRRTRLSPSGLALLFVPGSRLHVRPPPEQVEPATRLLEAAARTGAVRAADTTVQKAKVSGRRKVQGFPAWISALRPPAVRLLLPRTRSGNGANSSTSSSHNCNTGRGRRRRLTPSDEDNTRHQVTARPPVHGEEPRTHDRHRSRAEHTGHTPRLSRRCR